MEFQKDRKQSMQYHLWALPVLSKSARIFDIPWDTNVISVYPGYRHN